MVPDLCEAYDGIPQFCMFDHIISACIPIEVTSVINLLYGRMEEGGGSLFMINRLPPIISDTLVTGMCIPCHEDGSVLSPIHDTGGEAGRNQAVNP